MRELEILSEASQNGMLLLGQVDSWATMLVLPRSIQ